MSYAILVVEDEATLAKNITLFLERNGFDVRCVESAEAGLEALESFRPEAMVLDFNLPGMNGLELMQRVRDSDPQIRIVMVTGHGSEQIAVDAMKAGAYDYLTKPLALGKLKLILDKAVGEDRRAGQLSYYQSRDAAESGLARLIGASPATRALKDTIRQLLVAESGLADRELPAVLIIGETGTGKELVARALHYDGVRKREPFVEVNCSSIPAPLLEAELFGYERGAFTDAKQRKLGLIEAAEGGTLFLDEIGEMDSSLQVKLLKFLEDKTVRRLGSVREHKANVRVVAATNRNLEALVREAKFRSDLYFRLRIVQIELPPLRARGGDVLMLAGHFLRELSVRYGKANLRFSADARALLDSYSWPGNVRELRNVIEQSVILASDEIIEPNQLALSYTLAIGHRVQALSMDTGSLSIPREGLKLEDIERDLLTQALEKTGWNVTRAAKLLGVSRDTMRYRIEKHNLSRDLH